MIKKLIFITVFFLIMLLLILVLLFGKKTPPPPPAGGPTPPSFPMITPQPIKKVSGFKIITTNPLPEELQQISVVTPITLYFNQEIDPNSFKFTLEPEVETEIQFSSFGITFKPQKYWPLGKRITIFINQAQSKDGTTLKGLFQISFQAPIPKGE